MDTHESILERMARDALWAVVLTGIFWFLGKVFSAALWLLGFALVVVNEALLFVVKGGVHWVRRKRFAKQRSPEIIYASVMERIDPATLLPAHEHVTYTSPKQRLLKGHKGSATRADNA